MTSSGHPVRPRKEVFASPLEAGGVVFCARSQRLIQLNPTAFLIWQSLIGSPCLFEVEGSLRDATGCTPEEASQWTAQAIGLFRDLALLEGTEPPPFRPAQPPAPPDADNLTAPLHWQLRIAIASSCILISSDNPVWLELLRPALGHLEKDIPESPTAVIRIEGRHPQLKVNRDGVTVAQALSRRRLVPLIKGLVWQTAVQQQAFDLDIHAAVVASGGKALLMPAPPGSGKSTLSLELAHAGFDLLSDEVALVHLPAMSASPLPLAVCVKHEGRAALAARYPELRHQRPHLRNDGRKVHYLPPPRRPADAGPVPVAGLIFPRYSPGTSARLQPLSATESLALLLDQCLILSRPLNPARVEALVRWIGQHPGYRLAFSQADDAIRLIRQQLPT